MGRDDVNLLGSKMTGLSARALSDPGLFLSSVPWGDQGTCGPPNTEPPDPFRDFCACMTPVVLLDPLLDGVVCAGGLLLILDEVLEGVTWGEMMF